MQSACEARDEVLRDRLAALRFGARHYALAQISGVLKRALDRIQQRLR